MPANQPPLRIISRSLANGFCRGSLGDPAENIDRAIYAYQEAAQVLTPETQPVVWAITMNNVAKLFARRINGDRVDNLDRALNAFRQALTILSNGSISGTMPQESQDIILTLATGPQKDLDKAIDTLNTILKVLDYAESGRVNLTNKGSMRTD